MRPTYMVTALLLGVLLSGEYYLGDGLGVNWSLNLAANHEFTFTWHGCLGLYGSSHGSWSEQNGVVRLTPQSTVDFASRLPRTYQLVRWTRRIYLIPPEDLPKFCAYVNQGWEPRNSNWGMFFLRVGDHDSPASGKPQLPPEFDAFLLSKPVRAKVVTAADELGMIDAGSADHLQVGMLLTSQDGSMTQLRILSMTEHSALVKPLDHGSFKIGSTVSTLISDRAFYSKAR